MRLIFSFVFAFFYLISFAQQWQKLKDTPFLKHHSNGFGFNGKAYILQGINTELEANEFWEYDPKEDSWTSLDPFPGPPRGYAIGVDLDGKFYYGFGFDADKDLNDLWVFDPVDLSFTELASCPCAGRYHPALVGLNGKIFMGAGSSTTGDLKDWWEYDVASDKWAKKPVCLVK